MSERQIIEILQEENDWLRSDEIRERMTQGQGHVHKKLRQLRKYNLVLFKTLPNGFNNRECIVYRVVS